MTQETTMKTRRLRFLQVTTAALVLSAAWVANSDVESVPYVTSNPALSQMPTDVAPNVSWYRLFGAAAW
jgi:hypothetical protein